MAPALQQQELVVLGAGSVGLTTAAVLAWRGYRVDCVETDAARIAQLRGEVVELGDPALAELVVRQQRAGRLVFHRELTSVVNPVQTVLVCVPTPGTPSGALDLTALHMAVEQLRERIVTGGVVVVRSTVPPGTARQVAAALADAGVAVVSHPEFLREGAAVGDGCEPSRIVIGADDPQAARRVTALYPGVPAPLVCTDPTSAELIKYASNAFLAMKTSYGHNLGELAEQLGADYADVRRGLELDPRIGTGQLALGPGWGGACLPKDTRALAALGGEIDVPMPLVHAALATRKHQLERTLARVESTLDRPLSDSRVGVLGLAAKAAAANLRDSPALHITRELAARGCRVQAYDPAVPHPVPGRTEHLWIAADAEEAASGCDLLMVLTDWPEVLGLRWRQMAACMRGDVVIDMRACLSGAQLARAGLRHRPVGGSAPVVVEDQVEKGA